MGEGQRAPDPFRPGKIEAGRPFAKIGRPGFAMAVADGIVIALVAAILVLALR